MDLFLRVAADGRGIAAHSDHARARHATTATRGLGHAGIVVDPGKNGGMAGCAVVFPGTVDVGARTRHAWCVVAAAAAWCSRARTRRVPVPAAALAGSHHAG